MSHGTETSAGKFAVRRLGQHPPAGWVFPAIAHEVGAFALESTSPESNGGRYSILGFDPVDEFQSESESWLDELGGRVGVGRPFAENCELPFVGGWVGFISYEAGPLLEGISRPRSCELPHVRFSLYDTVAVYDHRENSWFVAGVTLPDEADRLPLEARLDHLQDVLAGVDRPPAIDWTRAAAGDPQPVMSRAQYDERVATAQRYIRAGDIYQVNLTQRFVSPVVAPVIEVYRRMRVANPAAYSAFLRCGDRTILSASPELFLDLRGGDVVTRPIKGTRPRTGDDVLDAVRARELLESEKDRAELTMIVDLMRNDLGRVSRFGSVRVRSAGDLEAHPTVFHLVGKITGELREGMSWVDLLRASYPGGSITGCPKIRAMQIIDELEVTERSAYCGSIGYIGLDGSMCLSIAIRTMVMDARELHLYGGGAIVADSRSQDEYEEIMAKIAGLTRALGGWQATDDAVAAAERRT